MPSTNGRHPMAADPDDPCPGRTPLTTRVDALGGTVEHVLDALEAIAEGSGHVDEHVRRARELLGRIW